MNVICKNTRCRFCKSGFCSRQYVVLNKAGGCSLWFTREGIPSPMEIVEPEINSDPSYRGDAATEVDGAIEQNQENTKNEPLPAENDKDAEIAEPTEKDEGEH